MKPSFKYLFVSVLFMASLVLVSCAENKKAESSQEETEIQKSEEKPHDHQLAEAQYQCPMKCEGEKTYAEEGTCPTCKMKLKKLEEENSDKES